MTATVVAGHRLLSARLVVAAFGLLALLGLVACGESEPQPFSGYTRTPTPNVADVSLPAVEPDGSQTPFRFAADDEGLLLVYFGFTSCPDVCPTTLADLRRALDDMGDDADRVDLAMISIDVEVDTPDVLATYVRSFVPGSVAVRTTDDGELRAAAEVFGADYGKDLVDGEEEVYHTASLYVIDDRGDLLLTWPFGTPADDIGADLERLLDGETPPGAAA